MGGVSEPFERNKNGRTGTGVLSSLAYLQSARPALGVSSCFSWPSQDGVERILSAVGIGLGVSPVEFPKTMIAGRPQRYYLVEATEVGKPKTSFVVR